MSQEKIPDIVGKPLTRKLTHSELEERIRGFLGRHSLCVLATSCENIPRATPLEYRSRDMVLYMMGDPGTKLHNIRSNPQVSVGVFDETFARSRNWLDVAGLQITGTATLPEVGESGYEITSALFGFSGELPSQWIGSVIRVDPLKIELLDIALKQEGYAARQVWEKLTEKKE
ncbi:MAG: pyridoxamine 5'-phosphate oxidase family protein [Chlorobium sp.]|nr:MAG: pyridoxamine 5'-phosphate oxidase family protein [Chlorobium sp.]